MGTAAFPHWTVPTVYKRTFKLVLSGNSIISHNMTLFYSFLFWRAWNVMNMECSHHAGKNVSFWLGRWFYFLCCVCISIHLCCVGMKWKVGKCYAILLAGLERNDLSFKQEGAWRGMCYTLWNCWDVKSLSRQLICI